MSNLYIILSQANKLVNADLHLLTALHFAVGAGILLCQVREPKEREDDAAGMGAWKIPKTT